MTNRKPSAARVLAADWHSNMDEPGQVLADIGGETHQVLIVDPHRERSDDFAARIAQHIADIHNLALRRNA